MDNPSVSDAATHYASGETPEVGDRVFDKTTPNTHQRVLNITHNGTRVLVTNPLPQSIYNQEMLTQDVTLVSRKEAPTYITGETPEVGDVVVHVADKLELVRTVKEIHPQGLVIAGRPDVEKAVDYGLYARPIPRDATRYIGGEQPAIGDVVSTIEHTDIGPVTRTWAVAQCRPLGDCPPGENGKPQWNGTPNLTLQADQQPAFKIAAPRSCRLIQRAPDLMNPTEWHQAINTLSSLWKKFSLEAKDISILMAVLENFRKLKTPPQPPHDH